MKVVFYRIFVLTIKLKDKFSEFYLARKEPYQSK